MERALLLVAGEDCATFAFFPAAFCLDMHEYYRGMHLEQMPLPIWDSSCVGELASYIAGDGINLHAGLTSRLSRRLSAHVRYEQQ